MNGQTESVEGKTLVLIAVHLARFVEAWMTLVWPGRPLKTVNSIAPLPEPRGALNVGMGTAATKTATIFECANRVNRPVAAPSKYPSIRSPPAELLTV